MKTYTITQLARKFGLARSTLLYYDRLDILRPTERSEAGYRLYSEQQCERLQQICAYREMGIPLKVIAGMLGKNAGAAPQLLQRRLLEITEAIRRLRVQQQMVASLLAGTPQEVERALCDRRVLVDMFLRCGITQETMAEFHKQFEQSAPEAHRDFLSMLGFAPDEITRLRQSCMDNKPQRGRKN